ncbi:hypothetical protein [Autumnicola psychrophila]|uniref:Uncharacterized protein n=1 Tax=Autumnicola psychrophila TaxID=3075592 RepID=A0ABU3DPQ0_9FLAO|nr:hypothetical protein [Zunongwangia sp. F225]MDT0685588.1 hypothetical protein [Zunongwangia sp. F225]
MKKSILLPLFIFSINFSFGQLTNSAEFTYANFYNATSTNFNLNTSGATIEFLIDSTQLRYKGKVTGEITAEKINGHFIKFGLTETDKFLKLNDVNFEEKNGIQVGYSFVHSTNKFFDVENDVYRTNDLWTYKFDLTVGYKRLKVLNPISFKSSIEHPITGALEGGIGYYLFNWHRKNMILYPQLNAGVDFVTYNKESLKRSFINSSDIENAGEFIVSSKSFQGAFGDYKNNVQTYYSSISLPLLFDYHWKYFPKIMLIPYSGVQKYSYIKNPTYNIGGSINLLAKNYIEKPGKTNKKLLEPYLQKIYDDPNISNEAKERIRQNIDSSIQIEENNISRTLKNPTFLTFGVDWIFQEERNPSKPNFFISGGFSL